MAIVGSWRRLAGLLVGALALMGCAGNRPPAVEAAGRRMSVAQLAVLNDPLANPRAQADPDVQRLTALRDQLLSRLRASEDELLVTVLKSAEYDEQAGAQLGALQHQRLLITLALRDVERQRRERADDVAIGIAPPSAAPAEKQKTIVAETDVVATKPAQQQETDPLELLLRRAEARLQQATLGRPRWGLGGKEAAQDHFSGQLSGVMSPPPYGAATAAARKPELVFKPDGESGDLASEAPDEEFVWERGGDSTGRVQAAAVVDPGAAPDLAPALRPFLPRMQACIPDERLRQGLSFTLRARLGTDGSVRGARLSGDHGLSASAAACVVDVMSRVRLPPGAGGRIVSVPMRISAR